MFSDLDSARLKRSFEYFVEHYTPTERIPVGSDPVNVSVRGEPSSTNQVRRIVAVAIANFVEGTQDFCREQVTEIDRDLQTRDAYTLSFLRQRFTRDQ